VIRLRHVLAAVILLAGVGLAPLQAQDEAGIAVGDQLSPLVIHDLGGKDVDLGTFIGKQPVLIEFWASWCTSCAAMLPHLKEAYRQFGDDVTFLGINVTVGDSREKVRQYIEREQPPFQVLYDDAGTAAAAWDPPATSFIVIADRTGRVVYTGVGGSQNLTPALQKVSGR
jgi:thiol-disulfide isomerase/thioredoxin